MWATPFSCHCRTFSCSGTSKLWSASQLPRDSIKVIDVGCITIERPLRVAWGPAFSDLQLSVPAYFQRRPPSDGNQCVPLTRSLSRFNSESPSDMIAYYINILRLRCFTVRGRNLPCNQLGAESLSGLRDANDAD